MCLGRITKFQAEENNDIVIKGWQVKKFGKRKGKKVYTGVYYNDSFHTFSKFTKCDPNSDDERSSDGKYYRPGYHICKTREGARSLFNSQSILTQSTIKICRVVGRGVICEGTEYFGEAYVCEELKIIKEYNHKK